MVSRVHQRTAARAALPDVVAVLRSINDIRQIELRDIYLPEPLEARALRVGVPIERIDTAKQEAANGRSFHESLLDWRGHDLTNNELELSMFHNPLSNYARVTHLPVDARMLPDLQQLISEADRSTVTVLVSSVTRRDGTIGHLPMLDFRIPSDRRNDALVSDVANLIEPGSLVIDSGSSYHLLGRRVLPASTLPAFLGRALLLSPIVDRRWVAHQLQEGQCALRIGAKVGGYDVPGLLQ